MSMRALTCAAVMCVTAIGAAACGADAPRATVDWPSWGNSAENTHSTSLTSVGPANVSELKVAWTRSEGVGQSEWETFPVVVGTTMYYTTDTDVVTAVDAATGALLWSYAPSVDFFASGRAGSTPVSRGVAVAAGRVFEVTYDDQLIALDARNGRRLWDVRIDDPDRGYAEDSPPTYWHGELIIGGPAGDVGLPGFLAAFDALTGRELWRTNTVLAGPDHRVASYGGGHVWMPPTVDPRSGTIYAATGNPTPAFTAAGRPGCDRWTDATVAVNGRTGAIEWGHTQVCNDSWDYDTDQAPALFDVRVGPRAVQVVGDGSKAGFYSTLDARTGALLARTPELVPYTQPHRVPTRSGALVCPGIFGGLEYGPPAYSPWTGLVYLTAVQQCMHFRRVSGSASSALAGIATPAGRASGALAAIDPASGRIVWRDKLPQPAAGGALVARSGLVFAGDNDGNLYAFATSSGRVLWRAHLGHRFGSAPIAYEIDGNEYVAVIAGGSALSGHGAPGGGRLFAFRLTR